MLNALSAYTEAGQQAARARNERDEARADFHARWFRAARALERGEDRQAATDAYTTAYRETRKV